MGAGIYLGQVLFQTASGNVTIPVSLVLADANNVTFQQLPGLNFTMPAGGSNPLPQTLTVTSTGSNFNVLATASTSAGGNWLTTGCSRAYECSTPAVSTVSVNGTPLVGVNPTPLPAGTYTGQVVFSNGKTAMTVPVTLAVVGIKVPPYEPKLTKNLAPGFYILEATLASGAQSGFWGLEVLTSLGQAAGGFNLGGALYASSASPDFGAQPAFGAFALSTAQTVTATMNAQLPAGATLKMRFLDSNRNQLGNAATGTSPLVLSQTLAPGFYICEAYSSASTFATYQLGLAADFFSGGVDTGGFLAPGVVGFGAFYVPVQQEVTMKLYGQNTYGAAGAGSMVLTLKDANRNVIDTNP
jgi:hypothetical protein